MRVISLFLLMLMLLAFAACPASNEGQDGEMEINAPAPHEGDTTGDTDAYVDGETAAATDAPEVSDIPITAGKFEFDGLKIGDSMEKAIEIMPEDTEDDGIMVQKIWAEEDVTGMVTSAPEFDPMGSADQKQLPTATLAFYDGVLVGYSDAGEMSEEDFNSKIDELKAEYGESAEEPPAWSRPENYQEATEEQKSMSDAHFWGDEEAGTALMAEYMKEEGVGMFMLINVEKFEQATNEVMNKVMEEMQAAGGGMPPMAPEDGEPGMAPPMEDDGADDAGDTGEVTE